MNDKIITMALDAGLLNYVDCETPRRYFIRGDADIEEIESFAHRIIKECAEVALREDHEPDACILSHFGIKS